MSFRMYVPNNFAQRTADGRITLHVSKSHEMPPLPYELSGLITHETWDQRTQAIKATCDRFSKPLVERVWFLVAMISTLVVPFPLYNAIFNAIFDERRANETFYGARAAGFASFLGVLIVFWAPLAVWKWIGAARMRTQLRQWETYDRANASGRFVPEWKVEMPGIFSIVGKVMVSTPPSHAPTNFSQGPYLPPYINAPAYMVAPLPPQGPMPGTLAYNPGYSGLDEKTFHEVKV